jgi:hypothetical protein
MSNFWSTYIIAIVALNIFGCAWLLMWTRKMDLSDLSDDGTTGPRIRWHPRIQQPPAPLVADSVLDHHHVRYWLPNPLSRLGQVQRLSGMDPPPANMPPPTSSTTNSMASSMLT